MWTAIWTLAVFVLALFLGESILTFAGEQLRERRAHRLAVERERTKQAIVAQQRDELIWRQLQGPAQPSSTTPADHLTVPNHSLQPRNGNTRSIGSMPCCS